MEPEKLKQWQLILTNALVTALGTFILAYEVVAKTTPDPTAVGAGLTLLLGPTARAYFSEKKRNGEPNGDPH